MKESEYLQNLYSVAANIYAPIIDKIFSFDRKNVIDQITHDTKVKKILEVGVGTGLNLPYYENNVEVHGVDFTRSMLKKAVGNTQLNRSFLYQADAELLPFQDDCFDAALTTYVLRVSPNPVKILQDASRCIKPSGLLVIFDQFSHGIRAIDRVEHIFKVPLGWGRNYRVKDLVNETPWSVEKNISMSGIFSKVFNVRMLLLKNNK